MYNTSKIVKNGFRISKRRDESVIRVRVPGGHMKAKHLKTIEYLAERYGNGTIHITTRQGYEIPGIKLRELDEIRKDMASMIAEIQEESNVTIAIPEKGYPSAGTRNVSACIGNQACIFATFNTTTLAKKVESVIYPNDYHVKIAITGCPNDCIKAHMQDIGIIGNVVPEYDEERCIACEACAENCRKKVCNALRLEDFRIKRDKSYCLQCGECITKCPTGALTHGRKLYRVIVGGRTGKRFPRLANTFIQSADESVILDICKNLYRFIDRYIDRTKPKEHVGYIIDRAGFQAFKDEMLYKVDLNPEARIVEIFNPGYVYPRRIQ